MGVLTNLNGGAKIVLKIQLHGEFSTNIELISINKDFVKKNNSNDFKYYRNNFNDFVLWSTQDFIFDNRQLRLPDEKNIKEKMEHTHLCNSDKERYAILKKLYNTLEDWSKMVDMNKGVYVGNKKKVIIAGDYWFVS